MRTARLAGRRGGGSGVAAGWRDPQRPGSRRFLGFTSRQMNAKRPRPPDDWGRGLIEHCKQPFDSEGSGIRSWGEQEADVANRSVLLIGWGYEQLHYRPKMQKSQ